MRTLKWEKVYQGPFTKKEAQALAGDLRKNADHQKNLIYDARVRARRGGKGYDVYIKTTRTNNVLEDLGKVGFREGTELEDKDDGQKRYLLEIADGEWHLTGYSDFCMCESWYSAAEIKERFRFTGKVVDIKELSEVETKCDCPDTGEDS